MRTATIEQHGEYSVEITEAAPGCYRITLRTSTNSLVDRRRDVSKSRIGEVRDLMLTAARMRMNSWQYPACRAAELRGES
jgi:hypothetical protein